MVSRENYQDVVENIIPAIEDIGVYGYIEPVIFSGNAWGRQQGLSLTPEQLALLSKTFASGGIFCQKRQSIELIIKGTKLAVGTAITPRDEDSVIDEKGNCRDVFSIFHNEYFREMRKTSEKLNGCLCRAILNKEISILNK